MYKYFAVICVVCALSIGCRSTKKIRKVIAAPAVHVDTTGDAARAASLPPRDAHADSLATIGKAVAGIANNHIDFQTFSAHMHVHFQGADGKDNEVNALVHITKDQRIWVAIFGNVGPVTIEAFRVLITPDSVKILDKLKKVARLRSVSYLQEEVHLPVDFRTLQDLLVGNPIFLDTTHVLFYRKEVKGISLFATGEF